MAPLCRGWLSSLWAVLRQVTKRQHRCRFRACSPCSRGGIRNKSSGGSMSHAASLLCHSHSASQSLPTMASPPQALNVPRTWNEEGSQNSSSEEDRFHLAMVKRQAILWVNETSHEPRPCDPRQQRKPLRESKGYEESTPEDISHVCSHIVLTHNKTWWSEESHL